MHHVPCVCALIIIIICPVRIILRSHTQRVAAMCKFFARRFVGSSLFCSGWPGLVMRRGRRGRLISCYNLLTVLLFFPPTVLTVCQIYRSLLIKSALLKRGEAAHMGPFFEIENTFGNHRMLLFYVGLPSVPVARLYIRSFMKSHS